MKPPSPSDVVASLGGAWFPVNNTQVWDNGTIKAKDPEIGLLQYTHNGWMAANVMPKNSDHRPMNVSYPASNEPDSDWAKIGRYTLTYAGPFSVLPLSATHGNLIHGPLVYAGIPSWVGRSQARTYRIHENGKLIQVGARDEKRGVTGDIWWKRANDTIAVGPVRHH